MKRSTERILTTHTGSLPRPPELTGGAPAPRPRRGRRAGLDAQVRDAVADVVRRQVDAGVTSSTTASRASRLLDLRQGAPHRLRRRGRARRHAGRPGRVPRVHAARRWAALDFAMPDLQRPDRLAATSTRSSATSPTCKAAVDGADVADAFMTAASPGVIALFLPNEHYDRTRSTSRALADAMKDEYDAHHEAGFVLQIDCPDLAMGRHMHVPRRARDEFRRRARCNVEALNHARATSRPSACACTSAGATTRARTTTTSRCATSSTSCSRRGRRRSRSRRANPRHEHEWTVFERRRSCPTARS